MTHIIESIDQARRLIDLIQAADNPDEKSLLSFQLELHLRKAHAASLRYDRKLRGEREPVVAP